MKTLLALASVCLSGCVTLGSTGWIAMHSQEIGQVALVAGAVSSVESATINGITLIDKAKEAK